MSSLFPALSEFMSKPISATLVISTSQGGDGDTVATLKRGTEVFEQARNGDWVGAVLELERRLAKGAKGLFSTLVEVENQKRGESAEVKAFRLALLHVIGRPDLQKVDDLGDLDYDMVIIKCLSVYLDQLTVSVQPYNEWNGMDGFLQLFLLKLRDIRNEHADIHLETESREDAKRAMHAFDTLIKDIEVAKTKYLANFE